MAVIRRHFWVSGKVQGVYFRETTRRCAEELGISGWVRNLRDGRVEGVCEGEEGSVSELLNFLERGPEDARVERVEILEEVPQGDLPIAFEVRRS